MLPARPLYNDSNFLHQWLGVPGAMVVQNDIVYNIKQQSPLNFALKIQKHLRKGANQFLIRQNYTEKERKLWCGMKWEAHIVTCRL